MTKARAMLQEQQAVPPRSLRPPKPQLPPPPPPAGPIWRWVRQGRVRMSRTWRPWWLLGLVEVVTHPRPRWEAQRVRFIPGIAASCGLPARPALLVAL